MKPGVPGNMEERGQRIAWLVARYIQKTITEAEHDELDNWINESDENMRLFEEWTDDENIQANLEWMDKVKAEESFHALHAKGAFKSSLQTWIWSAACTILLVLSAVLIFQSKNIPVKNQFLTETKISLPENNFYRASLEIGNNHFVDLESIPAGLLNNNIEKQKDGIILYRSQNSFPSASTHILRTPVGAQYQVQLMDGTRVWLNTSSKISYAPNFNDSTRIVQLTGEAYFEVAKDTSRPFIVQLSQNRMIKVLGTHFNVNCYNGDSVSTVSLIEGSLSVKKGGTEQLLSPGEEARLKSSSIDKILISDTSEVLSWKNRLFTFRNKDLKTIMREIERWYGVKAVFQTESKDLFTASFSYNEPLTDLLTTLEKYSHVQFVTDNNTIYIKPK